MFIFILILDRDFRNMNIKLIISPECHKIFLYARSLVAI